MKNPSLNFRIRSLRSLSLILLAIGITAGSIGCNYNDIKNPANAQGKPGGLRNGENPSAVVDYATVRAKVLESACLKCHGVDVAKADLRFDTYAATFPAIQKIRAEVQAGNMPPPPPRGAILSPEQKAMLLAWIDSGAAENTVVTPLPTQPSEPTPPTGPPDRPPTTPLPSAPDFAMVSQAVFIPHCVKCHSNTGAKGGVNLEVYANAARHASEIGSSLDIDDMPRKAPALDPKLKAIVYAWIDAGAPETIAAQSPVPVKPPTAPLPPHHDNNDNDDDNNNHNNND